MNGTVPRPLRLVLWILGGMLAVMAIFSLISAWQSQADDWWVGVGLAISGGVCLTIAATSHRTESRSNKSN